MIYTPPTRLLYFWPLVSVKGDSRRRVIKPAHHAFVSFRSLECASAFDCGMVPSLPPFHSTDTTTIRQQPTPILRIAPIYPKS
jgi:hypothetical protein